jgi:citrate/tricarballylate utilization protein
VSYVDGDGQLVHRDARGNFYGIFPHNTPGRNVWCGFRIRGTRVDPWRAALLAQCFTGKRARTGKTAAALEATANVARLKFLDGGHGEGCNNADDRFTLWRRRFHHFTYGFMLCFAATGVATLYHFLLDWSAPTRLEFAGDAGHQRWAQLAGRPRGPVVVEPASQPEHGDEKQKPWIAALSRCCCWSAPAAALLAFRETTALGLLLAIHLGLVMAFFLTMPYSKFAHGIFRSAALLKYSIEKRQPNPINAGSD